MNRRPALLAAALVLLASGCAPGTGQGRAYGPGPGQGTDPAAGAPPDCGPEVQKADGSDWQCVFSDDFDGDTLDASRWTVLSSSASGFRNGPECYLGADSPLGADDVAVRNGVLRLTARALDHEIDCPSLGGDFRSSWTGAFVTTYGKFATTYGRVEVRAAFPDVDVPGVHAALWLWPQQLSYGADATGEMDIAEYFSQYPDRAVPFLHYQQAVPDGTNTDTECYLDDPSTLHTYDIVWEPGHVSISYDGKTCLDHDIAPAPPLTGSQPFDQPFTLNLTQALGVGTNAFSDATPLPATTTVDYVRVWN